jgi:hypothetical protein
MYEYLNMTSYCFISCPLNEHEHAHDKNSLIKIQKTHYKMQSNSLNE